MKEKNQNRGRTIIALALIVILFFSAVGNIGRMIFGSVGETAVHEVGRDISRDFSQQDWDEFNTEMESLSKELDVLGEELGQMGEEIGGELGTEFEQIGQDLKREFDSIDVEVDPDINIEVEVGR